MKKVMTSKAEDEKDTHSICADEDTNTVHQQSTGSGMIEVTSDAPFFDGDSHGLIKNEPDIDIECDASEELKSWWNEGGVDLATNREL